MSCQNRGVTPSCRTWTELVFGFYLTLAIRTGLLSINLIAAGFFAVGLFIRVLLLETQRGWTEGDVRFSQLVQSKHQGLVDFFDFGTENIGGDISPV